MKKHIVFTGVATLVLFASLFFAGCVQSVGGDDDGTVSGGSLATRVVTISVAGTSTGGGLPRSRQQGFPHDSSHHHGA